MKNNKTSLLPNILLALAVLTLIATAIIVFGAALGLWQPITGFGYYRSYGSYLGYFASVLAIISLIFALVQRTKVNSLKALFTIAIGMVLVSPTLITQFKPPVRYPPIHDITTNPENPPAFTFLTDDRPGARNSLIYGGDEVAQLQQQAFADIQPIMTTTTPEQAFEKAKQVAKAMKWEIVYQSQQELRFEASAQTPYFHFTDDIVVLVSTEDNGSRIDIRSVSRIGRGDRGVNAKRIRSFIEKYNDA
jgi:uncharacterized protein (DUF1499 family)